jgi:hypothetical protein
MCSKAFSVKQSRLDAGGGKFCSRECHYAKKRDGKYVECHTCGGDIYRSPNKLKESQSGKFFCSKSCQTVWRNQKYSGKDHAQYKHGKRIKHRSIIRQSDRKQKCIMCDAIDKRILAVHHIDGNSNNNEIDNLTWICHNCHHIVHNVDGGQKELKEELEHTSWWS